MISDTELKDWTKADDADLPTLRRLEKAAIAAIEGVTGRYFGVEQEISEVIRYRGFPLSLANTPVGGVITTLEKWDGTEFLEVAADTYYLFGSFIFKNAYWETSTLTRFRVSYDAGYPEDYDDENVWDAPEDIKQAVCFLVAHWFVNRESVVVGTSATEVPETVKMLLAPWTRVSV